MTATGPAAARGTVILLKFGPTAAMWKPRRAAPDPGCVKTLFDTTFGCPRTIAEVPIVDPGAFYEVDILLHASFRAFLHSLDPKQS